MAATKLQPIDLDRLLGRSKNRIYRIGIELEGGWEKLPEGVNQLVHDGSIVLPPPPSKKARHNNPDALRGLAPEAIIQATKDKSKFHIGELPSTPLATIERECASGSTVYFSKWMKAHYPSHVNSTCGMHVHMSFKTALIYQRLMVPAYPDTIIAYFKQWAEHEKLSKDHPIWPRLKGESEFCQHRFYADQQVQALQKDHDRRRPGCRYTVVNYCHQRNGTLECRLLPMMDEVEQGIRAVQELIDITNAFLAATAKREERVKAELSEDGGELVEERIVYV